MRRRVDPVSPGPEINPVQINFEDLVLGESMFEPQGKQDLADLSPKAPLGRQKQVLGELLGNCAAAFDDATGGEIGQRRTQQTEWVDAEMMIKSPVFGCDHGLGQIARHFPQSQRPAEKIAISCEQVAVSGENRNARPALRLRQLGRIRQGQREITNDTAAQDHTPKQQHQTKPNHSPPPRKLWGEATWGSGWRRPASVRTGPVGRFRAQSTVSHRRPQS